MRLDPGHKVNRSCIWAAPSILPFLLIICAVLSRLIDAVFRALQLILLP